MGINVKRIEEIVLGNAEHPFIWFEEVVDGSTAAILLRMGLDDIERIVRKGLLPTVDTARLTSLERRYKISRTDIKNYAKEYGLGKRRFYASQLAVTLYDNIFEFERTFGHDRSVV